MKRLCQRTFKVAAIISLPLSLSLFAALVMSCFVPVWVWRFNQQSHFYAHLLNGYCVAGYYAGPDAMHKPGTWEVNTNRGADGVPIYWQCVMRPYYEERLGFRSGGLYVLRFWSVPLWLLAVLSLVPWAVLKVNQRRNLRVAGSCRNCGYDLRATTERCPECGAVAIKA
jgi:hypothetical protein